MHSLTYMYTNNLIKNLAIISLSRSTTGHIRYALQPIATRVHRSGLKKFKLSGSSKYFNLHVSINRKVGYITQSHLNLLDGVILFTFE